MTAEVSLRRFRCGGRSSSVLVAGERGDLVVCLHGFPDNHHSFRHQIPALAAAGYRVACPLLPGYEGSSADPLGRYDMEAVAERLLELVEQIRREVGAQDDALHLVGHDWGAIAGFVAVNKAPTLFRTYTSISIPYNLTWQAILRQAPAYLRYAWYIQWFQVPWLPERVLVRDDGAFIDRLIRAWSPGWEMPEEVRRGIKATLSAPGVAWAALAYYRAIPGISAGARRARQRFDDRIAVPTLLIEGARDGCIHPHLWRLLKPASFAAGMRHAVMEAGHFPHQEDPAYLNALLLSHLGGRRVGRSEGAEAAG